MNRARHFMPEYLWNPHAMIHIAVKQVQIRSADSAVRDTELDLVRTGRFRETLANPNIPVSFVVRSLWHRLSAPPAKGKKPRKPASGQREMLLPISGKRAAKEEARAQEPKKAEKPVRAPARSKKAG